MSQATVQNALVAWVKTATGLAAGKVILADQHGTKPANAQVVVKIARVTQVAPLPELLNDSSTGRPNGTEVRQIPRADKILTVTLTAYSDAKIDSGTAYDLLTKCQTSLGLPSVRDALAVVDVSPFDTGEILNVTEIAHANFESRAVLTLRFYCLPSEAIAVYDESTYIASVVTENYMDPAVGDPDEIDIP